MFQAKTEERKLLPQRTESQESDHDEEPRENQKLNKENKPKDKVERLDIHMCIQMTQITIYRQGM